MDKVSAVITTVNREKEVKRAIQSVLNQSYKNIEIVVVIDGRNPGLRESIENEYDRQNINIFETNSNLGGGAARNFGIENSSGKYIALLDDDDEWINNKIEKQVQLIKQKGCNSVIFNTVYDLKADGKMNVRPTIKYQENKDICEYLFGYKYGKSIGFVQTSTLFSEKETFKKFPFDAHLRKHQDWDWVVMANHHGVMFYHISEPLTIYHNEVSHNRVGRSGNYLLTANWLKKIEPILKNKEYSRIICTTLIPSIVTDGNLDEAQKKVLVNSYISKIKLNNKFSLVYLRYSLLYRIPALRKIKKYLRP